MSDVVPSFNLCVKYMGFGGEYEVSVPGIYVPGMNYPFTVTTSGALIDKLKEIKEYHTEHYDGKEGRIKLPFCIRFCNKWGSFGHLEEHPSYIILSSVPQFEGALGELPHHLFVESENDDSD